VEADGKWGFCNKHCAFKDHLTEILQVRVLVNHLDDNASRTKEADLSLVPKRTCARLGRSSGVSVRRELCAGSRVVVRRQNYRQLKTSFELLGEARGGGVK